MFDFENESKSIENLFDTKRKKIIKIDTNFHYIVSLITVATLS